LIQKADVEMRDQNKTTLTNNLKIAMDEKGYSLTALSRASGLGKSVIFNWSNGVTPRGINDLAVMAKILDLTKDGL
jgi:transcriptional regulator with XRE-family HTH domain